ncbi:MAG: KAP family P-loop NTPase fold protein [Sulfuriferula sp.]
MGTNNNIETADLGLTLTTDRPVSKKSEDRLVRGPFVTRLTNAITSWKGGDGVVIGLYGPWGCGKSSVKNLVIEKIVGNDLSSVEVIEFNPWQWRGHDDVSAAFFREVLRKLESVHDAHDKGRTAKKIRRYVKFLGIGRTFFDGVKGVVASLIGIVGFLGLTLPTFLDSVVMR